MVEPPHVTLPLGDINVVVVTDVHSWVAGHARHEEGLNGDYGDVLSFYRRLQGLVDGNGTDSDANRDLFFVMNGDFVDGTGLSTVPPDFLTPILQRMPWDAVNMGNHELYHNVQFLLDSGFVDHWSGNYLTTNAVLEATGKTVGSQYTILQGRNSRVLTFGFLYNFIDNCRMTRVQRVQDVVQQQWFRTLLVEEWFDAVLVLAHMDCVDPLVSVIRESIRELVGDSMPIQFLTGHSHRRCFEVLDPASSSMEAGRFLDTVGFVSFPRQNTYIASLRDDHSPTTLFQHAFLDANKQSLALALGLDNAADLSVPEGSRLTSFIHESQRALHLGTILGCSPSTFKLDALPNDPNSLWGLYLNHVVPSQLFKGSSSHIFVQRTGALRYSLFEGQVTMDDVIAVCPFNDTIYQVAEKVRGSVLLQVFSQAFRPLSTGSELPDLAVSPSHVDPHREYSVYVPDWNMREMHGRIFNATGRTYTPVLLTGASTMNLWRDFVGQTWPSCNEATSEKKFALVEPSEIQHLAPRLLSGTALILVVVLGCLYFNRKSRQSTDGTQSLLPYQSVEGYGSVF